MSRIWILYSPTERSVTVVLAWIIFIMVKALNNLRKRLEKEKPAAPPAPPAEDVKLLTEIRDLLASGARK